MRSLEKTETLKGRKFLLAVETSSNPDDYRKYEDLRNEVWADSEDNIAGDRNLANENYFDKGGALFIAVYAEDDRGRFSKDSQDFIGFSYGFVGVVDKKVGFSDPDNLSFYSQYTAVRKEFQNFGLGVAIKEFQRDVLRSVFKIKVVTCTFDPLTGVNAYRNIHRLGMDILEYKESFYENFTGHLNRQDVPTDRFFVSWDLGKKLRRPMHNLGSLLGEGHIALSAKMVEVLGRNGKIKIEKPSDVNFLYEHEFVLIEIPFDYYMILKETDVVDVSVRDIPLKWRLATRQAFQEYIKHGYRIVDFQPLKSEEKIRDFYILQRT
jgi:predicted GNAT superfamily acetyltransferase